MRSVSFAALPLMVRLTSFTTIFMAWVMIEEWIIDRHGFDRYLPFYKVGNLCLYDLAVAIMLALLWIKSSRAPRGA